MVASRVWSAVLGPDVEVVSGWLRYLGNRVRAYLDRHEDPDRWRHRAGVMVGKFFWIVALRFFADSVEDFRDDLRTRLGFEWLTEADFERTPDPEACWRRPFTFAEIAEGYAVDRERPANDGERENFTETLLGELWDGGQRVVLGRPGSGKSTVCRSVACRWHEADDTGPVLYRESGQPLAREETDVLDRAIVRAKARGPVLLVVEDAARRNAREVLGTVADYAGDSAVSFLLDSRVSEWESGGEQVLESAEFGLEDAVGKSLHSLAGGEIEPRRVPRLDEREVERVVEKFEDVTGNLVPESPPEILDRIRTRIASDDAVQSGRESGAWLSPMLLVAYHLPVGDVAVDPETVEEVGAESALEVNVREVYNAVHRPAQSGHDVDRQGREELLERLGVLVNVLNAAELGIQRGFVHALAMSTDEHREVKTLMDEVEGLLHFGSNENDGYWGHHLLWSELYLELLLEEKGEPEARKLFEDSVNAFFEFADDAERREAFQEWLGRPVREVRLFDEYSERLADLLVSVVFDVGKERPKLAPLYGTTEYSRLELPDSCSAETRAGSSHWRSQMNRVAGNLELAVEELESFRENASAEGLDSNYIDNNFFNNRGIISGVRGNLDSARDYLERSLEVRRELEHSVGEAACLNNLGNVAYLQNNYKQAIEYYERALEIARDVGDQSNEAHSLAGLGLVAKEQGNYETAREYHDRSLEIERELGNRTGQAASLNNLGSVALEQGDYRRARKRFEQCYDVAREVGDRSSQASSLGNLGAVAQSQGNYETAREYHERSLEIEREVGDRYGEAGTLGNLGLLARKQGNFSRAEYYFERAAELFDDIGAVGRCLTTYNNLVEIAIATNNPESGVESAEIALSVIDNATISELDDQRQRFEAHLHHLETLRGDLEDIYVKAIRHILEGEMWLAHQFFRHAWDRRDETGEELTDVTFSAGVGLAALTELSYGKDHIAEDVTAIQDTMPPERERLPDPVRLVFDRLLGNDVDTSPEELLEAAAPALTDTDVMDPDDLDQEQLGAVAFAVLLGLLENADDSD